MTEILMLVQAPGGRFGLQKKCRNKGVIKFKVVLNRHGGPRVSHVPLPEKQVKPTSVQVRLDDQSQYPPNS